MMEDAGGHAVSIAPPEFLPLCGLPSSALSARNLNGWVHAETAETGRSLRRAEMRGYCGRPQNPELPSPFPSGVFNRLEQRLLAFRTSSAIVAGHIDFDALRDQGRTAVCDIASERFQCRDRGLLSL